MGLRLTPASGLVLEDDYDAEHRYDRPSVPALRAVRPDRVCYTGSVSTLLAPALRIGWLLVPKVSWSATCGCCAGGTGDAETP